MSDPNYISYPRHNVSSRDFKKEKEALKAKGYPLKESMDLVNRYYDLTFKDLKTQMRNSILVKVPPGSGHNRLVEILASRLAGETNSTILPNEAFQKVGGGEAKRNLDPSNRADQPILYQSNPGFDHSRFNNQKCFIIDDVLSTGESTIRLANAMKGAGYNKVEGIAGLVTVENRKPSIRDLERVTDKIAMVDQRPKNIIFKDLSMAFGSFTRQRLNRFERGLKTGPAIEKGIETLKKLVNIEKQLKQELIHKENKITAYKRR